MAGRENVEAGGAISSLVEDTTVEKDFQRRSWIDFTTLG
jgi:hypothetical protein